MPETTFTDPDLTTFLGLDALKQVSSLAGLSGRRRTAIALGVRLLVGSSCWSDG